MSRTSRTVIGILLATALAAGTSRVTAQDATPPAAQPAAASQAASGPQPASAPQPPTGSPAKPAPVCFKLSGRCVEGAKTPAAAKTGTTATGKAATAPKRPLNLTAPDVSTVVPAEDLKEPLPTTDQVTEVQEAQTVSVKTDAGVPADVPGGFGALWWALNHPSQAWKILTPVE